MITKINSLDSFFIHKISWYSQSTKYLWMNHDIGPPILTTTSRQLFCKVTMATRFWSLSTVISSFIIIPACLQWDRGSRVEIFTPSINSNSNQYTNACIFPDSSTFNEIWLVWRRHSSESPSSWWFKSRWNIWNTSVIFSCGSVSRSISTWFRNYKQRKHWK